MPRGRQQRTPVPKAISVYFDPPLLEELRDAATRNRRSLSSEALVLIESALRQRKSRDPP